MRARDPLVACAASLLVPVLDVLGGGAAFAQASRTALVLLPWLAIAPLPAARAAGLPTMLAYLAPPLGLGVGLDLAAGHEALTLARGAGPSVVMLLLWAHARARACVDAATGRVYAVAWTLLLPGVAALHVALDWAPGGPAAPPATRWASVDPLVFTHRWGAAGAVAGAPWAPLLVALLVVVAVRFARIGREAP